MLFLGVTNISIYLVIVFVSGICIFYFNLLLLLPSWIKTRKTLLLLVEWFFVIGCHALLFYNIEHVLGVFNKGHLAIASLNSFFRAFLFAGFFILISTTYRFVSDWFVNERIKQQLENQNLVAELALLKSQINPHFLLNTLNGIYALAYKGSEKTADAIMRLSEIMQYVLYENSEERVSLEKEIHFMNELLSLQQLRMKDEMMLDFLVTGNIDDCLISPMLLVGFAENLCKHAVLNSPDDPAVLHITVKEKALLLYTRNKKADRSNSSTSGIGVRNVKRRLELLYPDRHQYSVTEEMAYYSATLSIKL
jgi:sensor histidine kinase YesM